MLERLLDAPYYSLDCETCPKDKTFTKKAEIKEAALHFKKNDIICISFAYPGGSFVMTKSQILSEIDTFKKLMLDRNMKKIGHNLKFDVKTITECFQVPVYGFLADTAIMAHLLDETGSHKLKDLALRYLGIQMEKYEEQTDLLAYCKKDSEATLALYELFMKKLIAENLHICLLTEMKVLHVMYKAEVRGIEVNTEYLIALYDKYSKHRDKIEKLVFKQVKKVIDETFTSAELNQEFLAYEAMSKKDKKSKEFMIKLMSSGEFNIDSPKQLAEVMYSHMGLPAGETLSTDKRAMSDLSFQGFRFADYIQAYKNWAKLCEHIQKIIDSTIDGKIHANFSTRGTETGRFSCSNPNLQQIPSKTKAAIRLRNAFYGDLIVADYSNVELRLLAHFTGDRKLLEVYRPGGIGDLHEAVSRELGVDRRIAKAINFGISYGMGSKKLAAELRITPEQAKQYIDHWYNTYTEVKKWKAMIERTICKYGYISCMGGTKRRFDVKPYLYNYGSEVKIKPSCMKDYYSAIREGINFVIQGSSAHITKLAINALADERIVLQVHDEIVISNPKRSVEEIQQILSSVVSCKCPITAEVKRVKNWGEAK